MSHVFMLVIGLLLATAAVAEAQVADSIGVKRAELSGWIDIPVTQLAVSKPAALGSAIAWKAVGLGVWAVVFNNPDPDPRIAHRSAELGLDAIALHWLDDRFRIGGSVGYSFAWVDSGPRYYEPLNHRASSEARVIDDRVTFGVHAWYRLPWVPDADILVGLGYHSRRKGTLSLGVLL